MKFIQLGQFLALENLVARLQEAVLVAAPDGSICYANSRARQLFGRRATHGTARRLLGDDLFEEYCLPILSGKTDVKKWGDVQLRLHDGTAVDVAASSQAIAFPDGGLGSVILVLDISSEIGLQRRNLELLEQQRRINRQLRQKIALSLREHEDDLAQLIEMFRLAPGIFTTFITEAKAAIEYMEAFQRGDPQDEEFLSGFRAMHTLKGNARSLGLNLIGGRAQAVEDVLEKARASGRLLRSEGREVLSDLLTDLRRAIARAVYMRQRFLELPTDSASRETFAEAALEPLFSVQTAIREAVAVLPPAHKALTILEHALEKLSQTALIPLQPLFDYLALVVSQVARATNRLAPRFETSGGTIRISPAIHEALTTALPHLVRNAVVHGIEPQEERKTAGKPAVGIIRLDAKRCDGELHIHIRDDGRGLDLERLRRCASSRQVPARPTRQGLRQDASSSSEHMAGSDERGANLAETTEVAIPPSPDPGELAQLVFAPYISTAPEVTLEAGRGVGATAAKNAVEVAQGKIAVHLPAEGGTAFHISFRFAPEEELRVPSARAFRSTTDTPS